MEDLSRNVELACPTCGCLEFEFEKPSAGEEYTDDWEFTCAHCGRTFTHARLIEANQEAIDATIDKMGEEAAKAFEKELEKSLKGLKNLKIKVRL